MTLLRCGVHTCVHNKNEYCNLDAIEVAGSSAQTAEDTRCASFVERKGDNYSNTMGTASEESNITCQAKECQYNNSCKCHAAKINIAGNQACHSQETECSTFKKDE